MDTPGPSQLRNAHDHFDALLSRKTRESEWQTFFAQHPHVLSPSLPLRLDPRDTEPLGRPGVTEPDFLFYPRDTSPIPLYGVIELKRPDSPIANVTRKNIALLTHDAETAIEQARHYRHTLHRDLIKRPDQLLLLGNSAYIFVIMGTSKDLIEKLGEELHDEQVQSKLPGNLQILPFDTLLNRFSAQVPPQVLIMAPKLLSELEPELILIPAGEFLMGSDPWQDRHTREDELPQHHLYLPAYHMAKTPVTNAQYAAFIDATGRDPPLHWQAGGPPAGSEDHPVVWVTWRDAMAYCRWLSKTTGRFYRLPSEAEWEKAARGMEGPIYPWGDEPPSENRCNFGENVRDTTPVGIYSPQGDSPYGCVDMAGNVWEWCASTLGKSYPYDVAEDEWSAAYLEGAGRRVLRGGSWFEGVYRARCAYRGRDNPDYGNFNLGCRLMSPI